jgi:hypothetical protein
MSRLTLGELASHLRLLAQCDDLSAVSEMDKPLYRVTEGSPDFWRREVPRALDQGLIKLRNIAAHASGELSWDDVRTLRTALLGTGDKTGLLSHAHAASGVPPTPRPPH